MHLRSRNDPGEGSRPRDPLLFVAPGAARPSLCRRVVGFVAVACLFLCSAPALFAMSRTLEEANRHKILLINEISEPQTLDPQICQGQAEQEIINSMMDGLVENDEYDQAKVVPGWPIIGTTMKIIPSGRSIFARTRSGQTGIR